MLTSHLFFHRGVTSHTLRRVTPSHHLPLTLSRTPHKVGVLCPSLPLPQFGKNPAGRGNLSHPFSLSSLCAIFSISPSLSLSQLQTNTNTPVFLTLLMVYLLQSTRQKLKFNYSSCDERSPASGDRKVISLKTASDAR